MNPENDNLVGYNDRGGYDPGFFHMEVKTDDEISVLNQPREAGVWPDWSGTFLHEYVHFLQDVSTSHGLLNLAHAVEYLKNSIKQVCGSEAQEFEIPLTISNSFNWHTNDKLMGIYRGVTSPMMKPRDGIRYLSYIVHNEQVLNGEGVLINVPKYIVRYKDLGAHSPEILHFGSIHIKEFMAHAIQCQFDPDTDHDIFPYKIVEHILEAEIPFITRDQSLMIALCDASLMDYHPARLFFRTLERIKENPELRFRNVESVYSFVSSGFICGDDYSNHRTNSLFAQTSRMAFTHFQDCLHDKYFKDDVTWFRELLKQSNIWRSIRRGFFTRLVKSPGVLSSEFTEVSDRFGIPNTTNKNHVRFFAPPSNLSQLKINPDLPKIFQAISHTFRGGIDCLMFNICKKRDADKLSSADVHQGSNLGSSSTNVDPITDEHCQNKPWQRIGVKEGCPYTALWRAWGLEHKIPKLKSEDTSR